MPNAPVVIHQYGRPHRARDVDGRVIERQEEIFFNGQWYHPMDYDTHFVYRTDKIGSATLMCTCGSPAGVIGHREYSKYTSKYYGEGIIACLFYTNNNCHSDGSK